MSQFYDVIIAGAGPVGLFLACELGLTGISVLVLERDTQPKSPWKTQILGRRGLNTVSVEAMYRRGLLGKLCDINNRDHLLVTKTSSMDHPQKNTGMKFAGHFAGISLDGSKLDLSRFKYTLNGPSVVPLPTYLEIIESTLTERAESLGVTILRGKSFSKIAAQDDSSITVETEDNETFRGRWLVGCDGGRSVVRKAAGFDFVGTDAKFTGYLAECKVEDPEGVAKMGFHATKDGMYVIAPGSVYVVDFASAAFDRATQAVTPELLEAVLHRVSGHTSVRLVDVRHASTSTDRCKQAATYRRGRVLLAGDSAHIHSPLGAQGLNTGLGDAVNLGWKLAATVRGETAGSPPPPTTPLALLDTYEAERHPVGEWVLDWTRAQVATLQPDAFGNAAHALVRELAGTVDGTNLMIGHVWGLGQRYGDAAHPLVGRSAPDLELSDGTRLGAKMVGGRGLLVHLEDGAPALQQELLAGGRYEARVDYVALGAKETCGIRSMLIRPDGIVAWVADEKAEPDMGAANAALEQWFGL